MSVRVRLPNPLAALDDRVLLSRFAEQHDQPAFEQLVKRHGRLVFGVCRRVVRDAHLAEDAFQAVFLVLARNPRGATEATSVGGWLFGVARRVGLAARRHEQRREKRELKARQQGADALPSPTTDFDDLLRVLDEELGALPDEVRAALVACFLEERTHDEAARELGWSLSTLRRRVDRGKELLRSRLARRGVTLALGLLTGAIASPARAAVPALAPSPASAALAAEAFKRGIGAKLSAAVTVIALAVGGIAFGLANEPTDAPLPITASAAQPKPVFDVAPAPRAIVVKPWVTVSGRVVFPKDQAIPDVKVITTGIKDAEVWKPFAPLMSEDVLVHAENRGIANAMVWLRPDSDDKKDDFPAESIHPDLANPKPQEHPVLAVRGQFLPRVLAARAGDRVTFDNRLPVPTNVLYTAFQLDNGEGREFNVLVGKGMSHTAKPLPAMRSPDTYTSSIYPWMKGYVWAFDHPYFAVTDANGKFSIANAPAGKWRLVVWHEAVGYLGGAPGKLGAKVTIPESRDGKLELDPLPFKSDDWPAP